MDNKKFPCCNDRDVNGDCAYPVCREGDAERATPTPLVQNHAREPLKCTCGNAVFTRRHVHNPYGHDCGREIDRCTNCGIEWEATPERSASDEMAECLADLQGSDALRHAEDGRYWRGRIEAALHATQDQRGEQSQAVRDRDCGNSTGSRPPITPRDSSRSTTTPSLSAAFAGTAAPLEYATRLLRSLWEETTIVPGENGALCEAIGRFLDTGGVPENVKSVEQVTTPAHSASKVISHYDDENGRWVFAENWHAIEGPNGQCACGVENGKCGDRLAAFVASIAKAPPVEGASQVADDHQFQYGETSARAIERRGGTPCPACIGKGAVIGGVPGKPQVSECKECRGSGRLS